MMKKLLVHAAFCAMAIGWTAVAVAGTAVTHTVKNGETLYRIASDNNMSVDELRAINKLSKSAKIQPGQTLKLYTRVSQSAKSKASTSTKSTSAAASGSPKVVVNLRNQPTATKKATRAPAPSSVTKSTSYPQLASGSALVVDAVTGQTIFAKNADQTRSIASITKLMTAIVVLDAEQSMTETLSITDEDVDYLKHTHSRLPLGTRLSRYDMLRLALMSSENRAASSLTRHYPGGRTAFLRAMNAKAASLGMTHTRFYDGTGLTPSNISTAEDLASMVRAAGRYELIREFSTTPGREVAINTRGAPLQYRNTNALVRDAENNDWDIKVSKTGYTQEAGRCLVMMATIANRNTVMVMLDSDGKLSPVGDANRLKDWMESGHMPSQLATR